MQLSSFKHSKLKNYEHLKSKQQIIFTSAFSLFVPFQCYHYYYNEINFTQVFVILFSRIHFLQIPFFVRRFFQIFTGRSGFNPRSSHTKDSKMVLDAPLLNTHHYKVRIKGKVEQSRQRSRALLYTLVL